MFSDHVALRSTQCLCIGGTAFLTVGSCAIASATTSSVALGGMTLLTAFFALSFYSATSAVFEAYVLKREGLDEIQNMILGHVALRSTQFLCIGGAACLTVGSCAIASATTSNVALGGMTLLTAFFALSFYSATRAVFEGYVLKKKELANIQKEIQKRHSSASSAMYVPYGEDSFSSYKGNVSEVISVTTWYRPTVEYLFNYFLVNCSVLLKPF
ncbi:MAG: hypothetical protein AAGF04_04585 [Chlamydiota bacterium]